MYANRPDQSVGNSGLVYTRPPADFASRSPADDASSSDYSALTFSSPKSSSIVPAVIVWILAIVCIAGSVALFMLRRDVLTQQSDRKQTAKTNLDVLASWKLNTKTIPLIDNGTTKPLSYRPSAIQTKLLNAMTCPAGKKISVISGFYTTARGSDGKECATAYDLRRSGGKFIDGKLDCGKWSVAEQDVSGAAAAQCDGKSVCDVDYQSFPPPSAWAEQVPEGCAANGEAIGLAGDPAIASKYCKLRNGTSFRTVYTCR
jgi:hypothetical protein